VRQCAIKEETLSNLGYLLALAKRWREAREVIDAIVDQTIKEGALSNLGHLLALAQRLQEAKDVIPDKGNALLTIDAIRNIVEAEVEKPDEVIQTGGGEARRIPREQKRERASRPHFINRRVLSTLPVPATPRAREERELIDSLREQWLKAVTGEQALERFTLVCELIPHHPELGVHLWNAFKNVNSFLEELAYANPP
jgi:hypothetical protein